MRLYSVPIVFRKVGSKVTRRSAQKQAQVRDHFSSTSTWWDDVHNDATLTGTVIQQRSATALQWSDELTLTQGARVLEIGSGAGWTTTELAKRGYEVVSIDTSKEMVDLTRTRAVESGVGDQVTAALGDAQSLGFKDHSFGLVVALGVMSYFESVDQAMSEMSRVLEPGGHLLITSLNPLSLMHLIEPRRNLLFHPLRRMLVGPLQAANLYRTKLPSIIPKRYVAYQVNRYLRHSGLELVRSKTLGFGPFTFLGRKMVSDQKGYRLHARFQALADRRAPILRGAGQFYIALARKPG